MSTTEQAEITVYSVADIAGVDTEYISDTGTVEAMVDAGIPLDRIAAGRVTAAEVTDNIVWLD